MSQLATGNSSDADFSIWAPNPDDIILVADVDEIVKPDVLMSLSRGTGQNQQHFSSQAALASDVPVFIRAQGGRVPRSCTLGFSTSDSSGSSQGHGSTRRWLLCQPRFFLCVSSTSTYFRFRLLAVMKVCKVTFHSCSSGHSISQFDLWRRSHDHAERSCLHSQQSTPKLCRRSSALCTLNVISGRLRHSTAGQVCDASRAFYKIR
jgi:hypothetical protein